MVSGECFGTVELGASPGAVQDVGKERRARGY